MTNKSKWIETELERGDEIHLVPIRSRLEGRKDKLRTVVQRLVSGRWVTAHKSDWVHSPKAGQIPEAKLNEAAEQIADVLVDQVEAQL
mgnify:CR=1 FL=1|jgi:hypothetical protein